VTNLDVSAGGIERAIEVFREVLGEAKDARETENDPG